MITEKQAQEILPNVQAAVAALHEMWKQCRKIERALGNCDQLDAAIECMAIINNAPASIRASGVRDTINASVSVDDLSQVPERRVKARREWEERRLYECR